MPVLITIHLYSSGPQANVTRRSAEKIEARVVCLIQDSLRQGRITRDEAFVMLERIVREVENEIAHAG